ncbi:MAG: alkaline phosphatase family protein [Deltaproteobacteria bacterium]|nr:alkaline phosphatase family protein [Deltaproteobacteria bacterium]
MGPRPLRLLFLGLDGADARIIRTLLAARRLPALAALARRGFLADLRSTIPAATLPAWATCLAGVNPGRHGVFDFARPDGYRLRFGSPRPAVPSWLESLAAAGLGVGAVGFPGRLHDENPLRFHVAGWDTPLDTAAGRGHVRPPELFERIRRELGRGALSFAAFDEYAAGAGGREDVLVGALRGSSRLRADLARFLCDAVPVDVLALHLQALDTAGHHGWPRAGDGKRTAGRLREPAREPAAPGDVVPWAIAATYEAVDEVVGGLVRDLCPQAVLIASDHGMGPTSDLVVSLNALLVAGGFQTPVPPSLLSRAALFGRRAALRGLPDSFRRVAFRAAGAVVPGLAESLARTAGIDLERTAAWSDELTYAPSVRLNVRGREPLGRIAPADRPRVAGKVAAFLRTARRPDGDPLFATVRLREEAFAGPHVESAPDVLLEPAEDPEGRTPVLCPPHLHAALAGSWHMQVPAAERSGGKGGLLRGSHRPFGILLGDFPLALPDDGGRPAPPPLDLRDVAPLVHELLDVPAPPWIEKPRRPARPEHVEGPAADSRPPAASAASPDASDGLSPADRRALAARLRALGYIEDDG